MSQPALGQKNLTLILVAVAVLLAAIIGVLVWQNTNSPQVPMVGSTADTGDTSGDTEPPTGMPGAQAPQVEFDPATAPVVPDGQTPLEYVTSYYEACSTKEYASAYGLLPVASQQYYGDAASFEQTLESYGITEFSVDPPQENGDSMSVVGWQKAQGMDFGYEWTFVKGDDGAWRVKARSMVGM